MADPGTIIAIVTLAGTALGQIARVYQYCTGDVSTRSKLKQLEHSLETFQRRFEDARSHVDDLSSWGAFVTSSENTMRECNRFLEQYGTKGKGASRTQRLLLAIDASALDDLRERVRGHTDELNGITLADMHRSIQRRQSEPTEPPPSASHSWYIPSRRRTQESLSGSTFTENINYLTPSPTFVTQIPIPSNPARPDVEEPLVLKTSRLSPPSHPASSMPRSFGTSGASSAASIMSGYATPPSRQSISSVVYPRGGSVTLTLTNTNHGPWTFPISNCSFSHCTESTLSDTVNLLLTSPSLPNIQVIHHVPQGGYGIPATKRPSKRHATIPIHFLPRDCQHQFQLFCPEADEPLVIFDIPRYEVSADGDVRYFQELLRGGHQTLIAPFRLTQIFIKREAVGRDVELNVWAWDTCCTDRYPTISFSKRRRDNGKSYHIEYAIRCFRPEADKRGKTLAMKAAVIDEPPQQQNKESKKGGLSSFFKGKEKEIRKAVVPANTNSTIPGERVRVPEGLVFEFESEKDRSEFLHACKRAQEPGKLLPAFEWVDSWANATRDDTGSLSYHQHGSDTVYNIVPVAELHGESLELSTTQSNGRLNGFSEPRPLDR